MNQESFKRKLTAVMSADVAGYSRLMSEDEAATVKTLETYREVMSSLIKQHRGRVVDSPGDNVLAEFASVVDAVQCAMAVQKECQARNAELPENRKMEFRIGVNLGDVIEEGERIYGDGVNIAARLEALADPGGICVSKTAFDHIESKLPLGYEYLGEQEVKNIPKPVGAYRVLMEPRVTVAEDSEKGKALPLWRRKATLAGGVALLLVVIAALIWNFYFRPPPMEVASVEKMAFPLPDKPSIAVLPFANMSEDPKQEYFSDGLTEEIITALSNVPKLFVIARNSSFTYKSKAIKVNQVAEELGIRYVLEGSIRKAGDEIRVTAQLIDALSGHHLWAERYDRNLNDIFAVQDDITKNIITALQVKLTEGEQIRAAAKGTNNLEAYIKYLQAIDKITQFNRESNALGKQLAQEAIALDPEYAMAYGALHRTHLVDVWLGTSKSPKQSIAKAMELIQKAIELDATYTEAHGHLGFLFSMVGEHDKAVAKGEHAVALNPNSAYAHMILGHTLRFAGRSEEAIPEYKKAIRLNPIPPTNYLFGLGLAYCWTDQYEEAIKWCEKAVRKDPDSFMAHLMMTVVYSLSGRQQEARAEAAEALRINPKFSVENFEKAVKLKKKTEKERFIGALRKAGLPETPPLPLPDKPSIAVLPFVNMSGDPEQEYFSDGISEEIINALVRWPTILVIPRSSSFIYKGKAVDAKQVGREMGVRYVLDGSVRREGDRVRITAQLIDVTTLQHLFSERYEREMKDIFAIQDEITMRVLTAMRVSLSGEGVPSSRGQGTKNIEAYLKVLEAEAIFQAVNRTTQAKARRLTEEAIALDPEYARAYAMMAVTIGNEVLLGVYENPQEALERAMALAEKAIQLDESEEMAHRVLGFLALQNKDYEKAISGAKRAVELAPNSVLAQTILGYFLYSAGRTEEAIPILKKALTLSPIPLPRTLSHLCIACRKARRYEEAVAVCRQVIQLEPDYIYPHLTLAATFAEMEKMEEARAEVSEVLRINPKYTVRLVPRSFPWKDQVEIDQLIDSLRKAGLK